MEVKSEIKEENRKIIAREECRVNLKQGNKRKNKLKISEGEL